MKRFFEQYKVQALVFIGIFVVGFIVYVNTHIVNDLKIEKNVVKEHVMKTDGQDQHIVKRQQRSMPPRYDGGPGGAQQLNRKEKQVSQAEPSSDAGVVHQKPLQTLILVD